MAGHAQPGGDIGDAMASLHHLLDGFDLKFFGVSWVTHGAS
jgi:hypothetical protein